MGNDNLVPAIEVKGLRKVYKQLVAVEDVSFTMYRGEAFGFLGPNGAGKSTVVKMLTGLVAPTKGSVRIFGQPVSAREARRRIGYLPELPSFHRWLEAKEFLEFHGRLYGLRGTVLEKRCREVLALVGLAGRDRQKLGTFSKGMMQRIGLAQALINRPDLGAPRALFDEPLVLELRVSPINQELLHRLGLVALAVRQDGDTPCSLLIEVRDEEGAADVAAVVHECGARLYSLAAHHRSLEQLFLQTIDASRRRE